MLASNVKELKDLLSSSLDQANSYGHIDCQLMLLEEFKEDKTAMLKKACQDSYDSGCIDSYLTLKEKLNKAEWDELKISPKK